MLPPSSVHYAVTTFRKFTIKHQFSIRDLIVLNEGSSLIAEELLTRLQRLFKFAFEILGICTCLFKFSEDFPLFWW